ncbi:hypothetical protein ACIA5C_09130 [Actinoplanes sp. NPDC051343]|uniref:hypothetical protein n=1 Tax=Actinoplanes sp. NPDC051343 TaxID=3363906 RepID=UPI0037923063
MRYLALKELVAAAGNRQINRVLHIMATGSAARPTERRVYFDRKKAPGKTSMEAMRALKRRLSDVVYRQMVNDAVAAMATGPGGHQGTSTNSSVTGSHPHTGSSEKSLPEPADNKLQDAGAEVHLAHPPGVKGFACRRVMSDPAGRRRGRLLD